MFHTLGGMRLGQIALQLPYQIRITDEQTSYKHSKNFKNRNEMYMFVLHKFQHTSSVFIFLEILLLFPDTNNQQYLFKMQ